MFVKINESIQIGLSIMDKYFQKIDPKIIENNEDDEDDETDDNQENLVLYEMKDPYILRPLPYFIGSAQYIEDDSIGLKDTDEEEDDEEVEEEEQSEEDEDEGNGESGSVDG